MLNRRILLQSLMAAAMVAPMPSGRLLAQGAGKGSGKRLRIGLSTYPAHFRAWVNVGYAGHLVSALLNRSLLAYDTDGALVGELARSWERESDLVWRFTLDDAKFNNGQPVTSADVKWTLEKILAEGSGAHMREQALQIDRIEIVDDRVFKVATREPSATIPALMAYPFLGILAAGSTDEQDQGIGAGPYVLTAAEKGVEILLTASEHYFREGLPTLSEIHITPYADENLRVTALRAGDVDLIDYVPWNAMNDIAATPGLKLDTQAAGAFMYLSFNGSGAFADPRLRQAVSFALRREEFVQAVFFGHGAPLAGVPRPSVSPFFDKELANFWTYDPNKAKALLKEAGHENGLKVSLLSTSQYTMHRDIAVLVQSQLSEIGIAVDLILPDWATRVTMGMRGQGDFAVQGIGMDSLDPDATSSLVDPTRAAHYNYSRGFEVPGLSALLARGRSELDEAKRVAIYAEADRLACEYASFCGVSYRATGFARSNKVGGLELLPDQLSVFSANLFDRLTLS
ncbi:MAG: ABC transporter substrate-binding protein [Pseudochelatococcus sp.]|jgi:peptide/nickel transport system substrate-binding protein|uniref:ABC transporter substrate-binding protein n=1 Tax=Pseudochelatococcus sp. TaxID=2020869 RepID=UPI003D91B8BB